MANLYDERVLGTRQKIALAQKLRESGQASLQGQMIGDRYVPASWTQHLAQGLKQGLGAYQEMKGEQEIKDIQRERAQATARAMNQMGMSAPVDVLTAAETPAQSPSLMKRAGALFSGEDQPQGVPAQPYQQTIAQNPNAQQSDAAMLGLMSIDPELGAGAIGLSNTRAVRAATAEKEKYERKQDELEAAAKVEAARLQREFLKGEHELTRAATAANRQAPQAPQGSVVEIVDPNDATRMIKINSITGEVYGTSGAEPKAAIRQEKAQAKIDEQAKGQESFQSTLYNLKGEYDKLNSLGSMKSDQDSSIANALGVKLKTSTGQLLGTETGTAISNIEQARKSIIQDIKTATGMSAGQINSNFELQNMLDTVTNPNSSYEAVQDQLNTMSKKFGTGEAIFPERLKFKQQANMVQGQAPEVAQPVATQPQAPSATGGFSIRPLP
jgi:hypothetical protein